MNNSKKTLEILFGSYFHQDWTDQYADTKEALDAFTTGMSTSEIVEAIVELQNLLKTTTVLEMPAMLARLGSYHMALVSGCEDQAFSSENDPKTARLRFSVQAKEWVNEIIELLQSAVKKQ